MTENQNDKKIEDLGENLLDITIKYIGNEKPKNESARILNVVSERLKWGTRVLVKKVKDNNKDFNTEFDKEKTRKFVNKEGTDEVL